MTSIAVVVPTHNRPELLAVTLHSVLAQRGVDLTVTVVDDGSSDAHAVPAALERLADPRLRLIRNQTPRGVSAARNEGILSTSSEWATTRVEYRYDGYGNQVASFNLGVTSIGVLLLGEGFDVTLALLVAVIDNPRFTLLARSRRPLSLPDRHLTSAPLCSHYHYVALCRNTT